MGTTSRRRQRQVEPQLVICGEAGKSVDDVIRALIDEWLVPVLVEEYIRLHQSDPRVTSSTIAKTEKSQPDCGANGMIPS